MNEQQLWSNEAEQAVLGCLLIEPKVLDELDGLSAADFYAERHRIVFDTVQSMCQKGLGIDALTVYAALGDKADEIGGLAYLTQCLNTVYSSAQAREYARVVREKRIRRDMLRIATRLGAAAKSDMAPDTAISEIQASLMELAVSSDQEGFEHLGLVMMDHWEQLYQGRKASAGAVRTGLKPLDGVLGGLHPSDLVILAARPSVGKSALAVQIAYEAAKADRKVGIISLEMSPGQICERLVCGIAGLDSQKLRVRMFSEKEWEQAFGTMAQIAPLPLYVEKSATLTPSQALSRARRLKVKHGLDLLIVDYLQLMHSDKHRENRQQEIAEISRSMKQLAMSLDVPVLALSQLSREVEKRENKEPQLSDLRESGSLEQDADIVAFLHPSSGSNETKVLVKKHRHGPVGMCHLWFVKERVMFTPMEGRPEHREDF
jgi:replicative DNA helicase